MFFGVVFDGFGSAAVGVSLAEDGVDGGAHYFCVSGAGVFFLIGGCVFREVWDGEAFFLEFFDGFFELRDGGGDVGEFDDVGIGPQGHLTEFGKVVGDLLIGWEEVGELGEDAGSEGDVA